MNLSRQGIERKLAKVIRHADFPRTSLVAVRNFIARHAHMRVEVDRSAWPILDAQADMGPSSSGPVRYPPLDISLSLHEVSLGDILAEALRQKGLKYIIDLERYTLLIVPEDHVPSHDLKSTLFTFERGGRVWVSTGFEDPELLLQVRLAGPDAAPSLEPAMLECVRQALLHSGLSWPEGSTIRYNPETGMMVVTNTRDNRRIIQNLVGVTTQLWLKPHNQQCLLTLISATIAEAR